MQMTMQMTEQPNTTATHPTNDSSSKSVAANPLHTLHSLPMYSSNGRKQL